MTFLVTFLFLERSLTFLPRVKCPKKVNFKGQFILFKCVHIRVAYSCHMPHRVPVYSRSMPTPASGPKSH